jgi:PAS domain-containing protein
LEIWHVPNHPDPVNHGRWFRDRLFCREKLANIRSKRDPAPVYQKGWSGYGQRIRPGGDGPGDKEGVIDMELQDTFEYTQHIIDTAHDPLIILFGDLTVALANRSFYRTFRVTAKKTEGEFIYEVGNRQWDIPRLRHLLEDILPKNTSFDNFEIEHDFPKIGKRTMLLNACRIYLKANRTKLIILTIKDISERKEADELRAKITKLENKLKKLRDL